MTVPSDEDLLADMANGKEQAMEQFYQRYSSVVYQFALKTLHNGADAAEVMNEVMLEVWRKADSFSGKSKVKTWLFSITHHKAVDAVRRKSRHDGQEEFQEETHDLPVCSLQDASSGVEDASKVESCMNQLKNAHRQVVYLTFFEGLAYPEIANILDIPAGTVKTRMMHAKKLLMNCLSRLAGGGDMEMA
ncbi:RNA polymerase sigma factor [Oceanicoccus sp. KOV_DT_Chl]|uniref:RNA polymerase sigma factor n=1 Tax=Oceanicoccus sp. KOV_DT_Chl TaxID=1904639 RepID=UPI000C79F24F|nr:sigma-70 family RNA polymerase sigma factor [Oceanicoccus sp. KOV_DT_Chl]